jgi:hypothetical protein
MNDDDRYRRAKARVDQLRGLYIHGFVYVMVNILLIAINLLTSPAVLWVAWPLLGWGVGLAAHAVVVYGLGGRWGREWEERTIRDLMERDQGR